VLFSITDGSKEKWDHERMKAATEAMRNKEIGNYKAYRFSTYSPRHKKQ
jgi:hypothetical protein